MFSINLNIGDVVLEDGRNVDLCIVVSKGPPESATNSIGVLLLGRGAYRSWKVGEKGDGRRARLTSGKVPLEKTL